MKIAFEIGSWRGDTIRELDGYDIIFAIEPVIENYRVLIKNIPNNVVPLCVAIGDKTEISDIYLSKKRSLSDTLIKEDKTRIRKVLIIKWDDLVDILNVKEVEYVKINIEGAEEIFLEGMTKVFPKQMKIQEHSRKGKTNIENLEKLIKEKGYKIVKKDKIEYYLEYEAKVKSN